MDPLNSENRSEECGDETEIRKLFQLCKSLKDSEKEFKSKCHVEMRELVIRNQQMEDISQRMVSMDEEMEEKSKKLRELEQNLNQYPNPTEVVEFENRIAKLDMELAKQFATTRNYYIMYNTSQSQIQTLERELEFWEWGLNYLNCDEQGFAKGHFKSVIKDFYEEMRNCLGSVETVFDKEMQNKS